MSGFNIPNVPDSGYANQNQAEPDSLDFQILGNRKGGVVSGLEVTAGVYPYVQVAAGEIFINGNYYRLESPAQVALTAFGTLAFFDVIVARVVSGAITCVAVSNTDAANNPRFPSTGSASSSVIDLSTDIVLASVWRPNASITSSHIVDKRIFVPTTLSRIDTNTISANRGANADTYVNTSWTAGTSLASPMSVKVGGTWYTLAYWPANGNFTAGTITATLAGNASTATKWANARTITLTNHASGSVSIDGSGDVSLSVSNSFATTSSYSTYLWSTTHSGSYYISNAWDGARWYLTSNHGAPVRVGYADSAGSAGVSPNAYYITNGATIDGFGGPYFGYSNANAGWAMSGTFTLPNHFYYTIPLNTTSSSTKALVVNNDGRVAFNTLSSLREHKENINDLSNALDTVKQLQPRTFIFKKSATDMTSPYEVFSRREQTQYGFVVEEVTEVNPDFIHHEETATGHAPQMWKHHALIAVLVGAVKELSAKVDALEAGV